MDFWIVLMTLAVVCMRCSRSSLSLYRANPQCHQNCREYFQIRKHGQKHNLHVQTGLALGLEARIVDHVSTHTLYQYVCLKVRNR